MKRSTVAGAILMLTAALAAHAPAPTTQASQARQDPAPPTCDVELDKTASPTRLVLGEAVQVRLSVKPKCPPEILRDADIVLAIDVSRSMRDFNKLSAAKAAAKTFVQVTDLSLHQVAVVGFYGTAVLEQPLTRDRAPLIAAIDALRLDAGTNIAEAIDVSAAELRRAGRADALPTLILISDGSPNRPRNDPQGAALRAANAAKIAGVEIFAIGLGNDVDEQLMRDIVSAPGNYYFAPSADELDIVYRDIAVLVGSTTLRNLEVDDELSSEVTLDPASPRPPAEINGPVLHWESGSVPDSGLTWSYTVTPTMVGTFSPNAHAQVQFETEAGTRGRAVFPRPMIEVLEPEPEPVCDIIHGWTITVHSFPDHSGVGPAGRRGCNNRFDSGDWLTAGSNPLPPLEYQLADAEGTVLFQGQSVPSAGRVDQWLYMRVCEPPPYTLSLLTRDLGGYEACVNSPTVREITIRDFRPEAFRRTEERFGFVR